MSVTERDLFLAILSMDSYHRGYDLGIRLEGNSIGSATLFQQSDVDDESPEVTAGFYAAAYDTQWGTVISYRGTTFNGLPATNDVLNGWAFAPGDFTADQLELATHFLETVVRTDVSFDITLTGHSLGGGLVAGFVANDNLIVHRVVA